MPRRCSRRIAPWRYACALAAALATGQIAAPAQEAIAPGAPAAPAYGQGDLPAPGEAVAAPPGTAEELVAEVRIAGNETVPDTQVLSNITTRAGRPFDRSVVQRDVRRLANLGCFVDVKPLYEQTAKGRVVIFRVVERPTIRYVEYLGNRGISDKKLGKETGLKAGGSVDPYAVEEGRRKIREYYQGRGYNNVQVTILEGVKATDQGVTYVIDEGPKQKIRTVEFIGNDFVSDGRLKTQIKSKPPLLMLFKGYVDREKVDADVEALTAYYRSFGFFQARVGRKIDFNEKGSWSKLTFVIHEGQRYNVRNVRFLGNTKFEEQPMSAAAKLTGGAAFEQAKMEADAQWVQELYGSYGYVFADVKPETVFLEEPGQVDVIYHIDEGDRWRVGRIFVHIGGDNPHTRLQTALNRCTLRPGQIMDIRELHASERRLLASSLFNTDPQQGERPKITYQIPEDVELGLAKKPRRSGDSFRGQSPALFGPPVIGPPSMTAGMELLAAPEAATPSFVPADAPAPLADGTDLHVFCSDEAHYQRWLAAEAADGAVVVDQNGEGPAAETRPSVQAEQPRQPQSPSSGPSLRGTGTGDVVIRGQSPDPAPQQAEYGWSPVRTPPTPYAAAMPATPPAAASGGAYDNLQIRGQSPGAPPQQVQQAYATVPMGGQSPYAGGGYGGQVVRATGPEATTAVDPAAGGVQPAQYSPNLQPPAGSVYPQPLNAFGPLPGYSVDPESPLYSGSPGLPNYPEGTVDIFINGQETQTGRLMIGAGVNSNAGVVGNISVDERNFDWTRLPTSWEDVRNGSAFRGAGQRFRIDASPGSQVSRYLVSWQEPYLFDRPVSLGLSGSYYTRRFRDWDEQRMGGRVALGYQWVDRDLTVTGAYRGENVNISRPSTDQVAALNEVLGDNVLHGFQLSLINDTRDSGFLATQGHYFQISGEQVIGTFDYPRLEVDFRKYFMLRERPDHSGRHVLSGATTVGFTGTHTPIYENYFAGGFDTLRGFNYRGASPVSVYGPGQYVQVGGEFQWLNSVQYLFPITADDMLHGVVFSDFGTVEPSVELKDYRVAIGTGLRITVPAMGPAPIALDFAWAVKHADFDDRQVFSFSLGFSR